MFYHSRACLNVSIFVSASDSERGSCYSAKVNPISRLILAWLQKFRKFVTVVMKQAFVKRSNIPNLGCQPTSRIQKSSQFMEIVVWAWERLNRTIKNATAFQIKIYTISHYTCQFLSIYFDNKNMLKINNLVSVILLASSWCNELKICLSKKLRPSFSNEFETRKSDDFGLRNIMTASIADDTYYIGHRPSHHYMCHLDPAINCVYSLCDVTLSVYPHRLAWKICLATVHGNRTYDLGFGILAQCSVNWATRSGRFEYAIFRNWV